MVGPMPEWWRNDRPGNKRDRARYAALDESQRATAHEHSWSLYDGTRTISRCWTEALDAIEAQS